LPTIWKGIVFESYNYLQRDLVFMPNPRGSGGFGYKSGRPWEKTTDYLRHAAVHHAGNATTPTLIQHGAEDIRAPLAQGKAFYRALKKNDVHVEMVIDPRTPHGLREPKLIRHALEGNLEWFDKWVLSAESTTN
jgi:dipeptidyl aminopeptidase/acylaminoacyl peptidase